MTEERPALSDLFATLADGLASLIHKEIALARSEGAAAVNRLSHAAALFAFGIAFSIGAIGVLLAAIVSGISAILVERGLSEPVAGTYAALITAVATAIIAGLVFWRAAVAARSASLSLERTVESIGRDAAALREHL